MVRGVPAFLRGIVLKHGEIRNPEHVETTLMKRVVTLSVLARQLHAKLSGCHVDGIVRAGGGRLPLSRTGDQDEQIVRLSAGHLAYFSHRVRKRFFQSLNVVDHAGVFAVPEEGTVVVALVARELADLWNADGHNRKIRIELQCL